MGVGFLGSFFGAYLGNELVVVGQMRPAVDAGVCTVAVCEVRLERLHHGAWLRTLEGEGGGDPRRLSRVRSGGPPTQPPAMQPTQGLPVTPPHLP